MTRKYSDFEKETLKWLHWSRGYLQSGDALCNLRTNKVFETTSQPSLDMLCAHGAELALKGCLTLLSHGQIDLRERFGHSLLKLWDSVSSEDVGKALLAQANNAVRNNWKKTLRAANDEIRQNLADHGINPASDMSEFGVLSNSDIGDALPQLRDAVSWLNHRHLINGSQFRYPWTGLDERQVLRIGKFEEDMVHRSIIAGFNEVCDRAEGLIRKS